MSLYLAVGCSAVAALFAILAFLRVSGHRDQREALTRDDLTQTVRQESDRIRADAAEQARGLRQEVAESVGRLQAAMLGQYENFAKQLTGGMSGIEGFLHRSLAGMSTTGETRHQAMIEALNARCMELAAATAEAARESRTELTQSFERQASSLNDTLGRYGAFQKERLEAVTRAIGSLTESQAKSQESLRAAVESRLDAIRLDSADKLEQMRKTVDEKLQSTLEKRLGESFKIVSAQLESVYQGLGEMKSLAAGVGDLKKVLSNVKVRGAWGEIQLGSLLEQFLAPEQYIRNAQVKDGTLERVEFAVRLPGHEDGKEVLLPIDAKFPQEDFERLIVAAEKGDG
ncbi:MAG: DNA recombination protein RmuC, partial [Candidatus Binataceae bacterium]